MLEDRLCKWESGQLDDIMRDCKVIQNKLVNSKRQNTDFEKLFVRFMLLGKVNAASRLLESDSSKGVLTMNEENMNLLIDKHPQGALAYKDSLLFRPILDIPLCYFNSIDEQLIEKAINQTSMDSSLGTCAADATKKKAPI